MSEWVVVGKLLGPYGIKGWMKVYSHTEPMDNLANYNPLWLHREGNWQPINVERVQRHGKGLVAKIEGCDNRDQVPAFTGCELAIKREQLPDLQDEDFYWSDLEGLTVKTLSGDCLGKVSHLFETGANDVLVVQGDADSLDRQERLIPYIWEEVVQQVDLAKGEITVDWDKDF
ncbi:ribosome maturation factor RimM [Ketobacter sp.]|uniref:ribosome maturation factor RimM n=1 Tax=Ketobacter sp. TaxID=2083498 RepID=UPI000F24D01D|nr:ribosome maturation factor RimM [Ketobacter sp.]RLT94506.1 MAG: ribosome maturation factor RimM [Ketobacter sp.]